jgi:hypothetical protein
VCASARRTQRHPPRRPPSLDARRRARFRGRTKTELAGGDEPPARETEVTVVFTCGRRCCSRRPAVRRAAMAEDGVRRRTAAAGGCERAGRPATVARVRGRAGYGGAERWVGCGGRRVRRSAAAVRGCGGGRRCAGAGAVGFEFDRTR